MKNKPKNEEKLVSYGELFWSFWAAFWGGYAWYVGLEFVAIGLITWLVYLIFLMTINHFREYKKDKLL